MLQPTPYLQLREHLIKIGIDKEVVKHMDSLEPQLQQEIVEIFTEVANDELLIVLALKDFDFVENYINSKKRESLLQ